MPAAKSVVLPMSNGVHGRILVGGGIPHGSGSTHRRGGHENVALTSVRRLSNKKGTTGTWKGKRHGLGTQIFTMPLRIATVTACVRSVTSSLLKMFATWVFTVLSLTDRLEAISLLAAPVAMSPMTSISR